MNAISKVSEITAADAWDYMRPSDSITAGDTNFLNMAISVAKAFMCSYTGHTVAELDAYSDFVIVVFVLVQDMWDNRSLYVDNINLNFVIQAILDMHSINYLPQEALHE